MDKIILKLVTICFLMLSLLPVSAVMAQDTSRQSGKRIDINLTKQQLIAYQDGQPVYIFPVSSGKTATPTPIGLFHPLLKKRWDDMTGGNKSDGSYYYLPDVPYVIYFDGSYALHGTYWHHNFGHPMSHGCINLNTSDMAQLYSWIDMNTPITIFGNTPAS